MDHIISRCFQYDLSPIVCTTNETSDDEIVTLAKKWNVPFFRGPTINKLLRWHLCCKFFNLDAFHSVDADDPFFCGDEVKRSLALLREGYDMVAPTQSSSAGGATVGYSLTSEIIALASEGLNENVDTEMMWSYVERVPGINKKVLGEPADHVIRARMTLDYWEDYIMLEAIRLIVGNRASRADISRLFSTNPSLEKINAFRSAEWSQKQKSKSLELGNTK